MSKRLIVVLVLCFLLLQTACWMKGSWIQGQVTDLAGNPISGVTVSLVGKRDSLTVTTNESGRWEAIAVHEDVTVNVVKDGWCFGPTDLLVTGSREEVDFIGTPEQRIQFVDPNLASAVEEMLDGSSPIYVSDLLPFQEVDLSEKNVSELSGIEYFLSLHSLRMDSNQIHDLEQVGQLKNLRILHLSDNQIDDLTALSANSKLINLYLNGNQLADLAPLGSLTQLEFVYIEGNQIHDLSPLSNSKEVKKIDASDNPISDLSSLSNFSELMILDLANTLISDIDPLAENQDLRELYLGGTGIQNLSVLKHLPLLRVLDLQGTQIEEIQVLLELDYLREVCLQEINTLDTTPGSAAWNVIKELVEKGVNVIY